LFLIYENYNLKVVSSKCRIISSKKVLSDKINLKLDNSSRSSEATVATNVLSLPNIPKVYHEIHSSSYHLVSADLRNINDLEKALISCDIDFNVPTLFISECVFVYLTVERSSELLSFLSSKFSHSYVVNYEMCNLNDKFGQIMLENMESRGCALLGGEVCKSIEMQRSRFENSGFPFCEINTMTHFYKQIDEKERKRIESIEFLDEVELLTQLLDHYCIALATNYDNKQNFIL
jgi:[phosphatase 2A protein]-leucine-carboxy methyltransferase